MINRRKFIERIAYTGAASAIGFWPGELLASGEITQLTILHTNDIHCHIDPFPSNHPRFPGRGGMARLGGLVKRYREENSNLLLLDAGDMFQGTPYFNYYKGELIIRVMNELGYDATTVGNHEFDNGLSDMEKAFDLSKFSIISSNYDFSETVVSKHIDPFKIIDKDGIKIGIYGLGIELNGLVSEENYEKTRYLDPIKVMQKMETRLKDEFNCDLIVCLSHLGYSYKENKISDSALAKFTKHTDLIIGGHTHTFLDRPVEVPNKKGTPVIINQVGWAGLSIGKIDLYFDHKKQKKIILNNIVHV